MVEIPTRKLKMASQITLRDFWHLLSEHDWSFQYSDDHRQWDRGRQQRDEIKRVLKFQEGKSTEYHSLYIQFATWAFDAYGDVTKPEKPE